MTLHSQFDVFLCHNSKDKLEVKQIAEQLKQQGLKPWLDEWEFRPGSIWQEELERQIENNKSVAVFVGSSGLGPWQEQEIYAFLRECVRRKCPVIPVLLPTAPQQPQLPIFLSGYMWVDFRQPQPEPMGQLIWGITGIKPQFYQSPNTPTTKEYTPTPSIHKPPIPEDDLSSEKGIDYTRLRDLLKAGNWKEADKETLAVMLKAAGKEQESYLYSDDIEKLPCTDLRTIDQLWVKYSNGRFGFSVQKRIWESVGKDYEKFGDRVGWRKVQERKKEEGWLLWKEEKIELYYKWLDYSDINFSIEASNGHLPLKAHDIFRHMKYLIYYTNNFYHQLCLFSRVQTCKM
ncbi:MAG: GUN4 domain-containing protein [Rivularia sp. (in: cyanobacteria)]